MSGVRVDHRGVCIPPPSDELFDTLAQVAYETAREDFAVFGFGDSDAWHKTEDDVKVIWRHVARAVYTNMAARAGGKVKVIPDG